MSIKLNEFFIIKLYAPLYRQCKHLLFMSSSGSLILFCSIGLLVVVGMVAMSDFHVEASNNSNSTIQADSALAMSTVNPIFSVLGYVALAVAAIALLSAFRNM